MAGSASRRHDGGMDPRLTRAVEASRAWYDDVFALHRVPTACDGDLWRALGDPPPYHSTAKTLRPGVAAADVVAATSVGGSVADSFADLDLPGFTLLFEASWVHHDGGPSSGLPDGWSVVTTPELLALWSERHDYVGVLPAAVLDRPAFTVLAWHDGDELVGGAVLHDGAAAVGLSNAWSVPDRSLDWEELLAAGHAVHPDRELTDYAGGEDPRGMLETGWDAVGTHRVWVR
jgi:hypothetical protein